MDDLEMLGKGDILEHLYRIVEDFNAQLGAGQQLPKSPETVLVGQGGVLDSLGLLNFLSLAEEELARALGRPVRVMDEAMMVDEQGPLRTLGSLADFVTSQI